MKEVLITVIITFLVFLSFGVALGLAIVKQKSHYVIAAILTFLLTLGGVASTVYLVASKSIDKFSYQMNKASKAMEDAAWEREEAALTYEPRLGTEIYEGIFGAPTSECVTILNSKYKNDFEYEYDIWLHFETCPEEIDRIIAQQVYEIATESTAGWDTSGPLEEDNWFKPELLGDKVSVYISSDDYGDEQTLYVNLEKTEVYFTGLTY